MAMIYKFLKMSCVCVLSFFFIIHLNGKQFLWLVFIVLREEFYDHIYIEIIFEKAKRIRTRMAFG
jgi:hypothetical protein